MITKMLSYITKHLAFVLIIVLALIFIGLIISAFRFYKSGYSKVSGNSYFKTICSKRKRRSYWVFISLEKLPGYNKLLTDVYLPRLDGDVSKLDLLLINKTGIYVFDLMNLRGWIYGNEKSRVWKKAIFGIIESMFPNPIWQNTNRISALSNILKDINRENIYSYIVFSKHCKLKKIKFTIKNIYVSRSNHLSKKLIEHFEKTKEAFTDKEIYEVYTLLQKYSYNNKISIKQHIEEIRKI